MKATSRQGFSLLELLVVVGIMLVLAGLLLAIIGGTEKQAKQRKTDGIIQAVQQAIGLASAHKSFALSPNEHPFAGSRADAGGERFQFVRIGADGKTGAVATTDGIGKYALKGVEHPSYLDSDHSRLLLGDDRYADARVPLLYGALRKNIGVLQSLRKVVTKYRLLPHPPQGQAKVVSPVRGISGVPYTDDNYPDTLNPTAYEDANQDAQGQPASMPYGLLGASKSALDYLFGNSNAQAELAAQGAIFNADPILPLAANPYKTGIELRSVGGNSEALAYTNYGTLDQPDIKTTKEHYEPGYICVTAANGSGAVKIDASGNGKWVKYRLAGMAVYDAWGNELITAKGENDSFRVISAGPDGVLAINPGKNRTFDTALTGNLTNLTDVITGDDKNGTTDNQPKDSKE